MTQFSLEQQLEEVEREIALRNRVYPTMIAKGRMRESVAQYHTGRMHAVAETLRRLIQQRSPNP